MSAIFNFSSLILVVLLMICTCTYLKELRPTILDGGLVQEPGRPLIKRPGLGGFFWKLSRIGERLSPYISASCLAMAIHVLFFKS
mmetsp:Transcript_29356/g.28227  ORF Transcript_29356/g.28227 Transcript_29356/m.28227 type:complete len:85 (+) Transcript_29356:241-495(+)